ncbi:acetate--CoA ligase family protein [Shigella flexneri]
MHIAEQIGYPVALKLRSPDIPHKSEAQGVMLYLRTATEVQQAADAIATALKWLAAARIHRPAACRVWLTVLVHGVARGGQARPIFGPLIMLGEGGVEWRAEDQPP